MEKQIGRMSMPMNNTAKDKARKGLGWSKEGGHVNEIQRFCN